MKDVLNQIKQEIDLK